MGAWQPFMMCKILIAITLAIEYKAYNFALLGAIPVV